jgi:phage terminase small subunit
MQESFKAQKQEMEKVIEDLKKGMGKQQVDFSSALQEKAEAAAKQRERVSIHLYPLPVAD